MESFKMFSCRARNVSGWKRLIPAKLPNTLSGCPGTWLHANHYATIKKWLDEDSKGRSAKNYTYDDNEGECL